MRRRRVGEYVQDHGRPDRGRVFLGQTPDERLRAVEATDQICTRVHRGSGSGQGVPRGSRRRAPPDGCHGDGSRSALSGDRIAKITLLPSNRPPPCRPRWLLCLRHRRAQASKTESVSYHTSYTTHKHQHGRSAQRCPAPLSVAPSVLVVLCGARSEGTPPRGFRRVSRAGPTRRGMRAQELRKGKASGARARGSAPCPKAGSPLVSSLEPESTPSPITFLIPILQSAPATASSSSPLPVPGGPTY